ncbi:MAG: InlB B-repeat-containing protein [Actinomycetota bacterium]
MSDEIRRKLGEAVGSFDPDPEVALEPAQQRGRRLHRRRQMLAGVAAVAISGSIFATLWTLYSPADVTRPATPLPGPTIESEGYPPLGKAHCDKFHFDIPVCSGRSGPVVLLAEGEVEGKPWSLRAFRAVWDGPELGGTGEERPRVIQGLICTSFSYGGQESTLCEWSSEPGTSSGIEMGGTKGYDEPLAEDPGDDPFANGRGGVRGGFSKLNTWNVGTTSPETVRIVATLDDGSEVSTQVIAGDPLLGTRISWYVLFLPIDGQEVAVIAEDANGEAIWTRMSPIQQRLFIERDGSGTGSVRGYWTSPYEHEVDLDHKPNAEFVCGPDCWYSFVPNPTSETFTLVAEPEPGSSFAGWGGPCEGQDETCEITMPETQTVIATFEKG